jgi:hypothetical protein
VDLVPEGAVWRSRAGDAPASVPDATAWRSSGFDDSKWVSGPLPLYYGEALTGTTITGMQGVYPTYFVRTLFQFEATLDHRHCIVLAYLRSCPNPGYAGFLRSQSQMAHPMGRKVYKVRVGVPLGSGV